MASRGMCKKCAKEFYTIEKTFSVSAYTDQVGYQKEFDTIEEASIELQKVIHTHKDVTFRTNHTFVEKATIEPR